MAKTCFDNLQNDLILLLNLRLLQIQSNLPEVNRLGGHSVCLLVGMFSNRVTTLLSKNLVSLQSRLFSYWECSFRDCSLKGFLTVCIEAKYLVADLYTPITGSEPKQDIQSCFQSIARSPGHTETVLAYFFCLVTFSEFLFCLVLPYRW